MRKWGNGNVPRHFLISSFPLLSLVLLALALRLWGITWGLPNQERILSYHPDEGPNLVLGVLDREGAPRPHLALGFYNYGGLYFYLWQDAAAVNSAYSFVSLPQTGAPGKPVPESPAAIILVGRLLTALLGALTVWAAYALGNRLFGRATGLLAGALYAIMPAAVVHGHYATVDVPATFFVTLALVCSARLMGKGPNAAQSKIQNPKSKISFAFAALSGLFSGLAAATKYNCGLVLLAPLAALALNGFETPPPTPPLRKGRGDDTPSLRRRRLGGGLQGRGVRAAVLVSSAVVGFLLGCPGILLDGARFRHDFIYELRKSGEGMGALFAQTGSGWLYHVTNSLRFGLGAPLLLFALAAVAFALARRTRQDWFLMAFLVPYYLVIGYAQVRFLRYVIPLFPVLAVLIARFVMEPWTALTPQPPLPEKRERGSKGWGVRAVLCAIACAVTLLISLAMDRLMVVQDARDQALQYITANVPAGSSIAFAATPWYDTPPLSPYFTALDVRQRRQAALEVTRYRLRLPAEGEEWDMDVFAPPLPDYVILSDLQSEDWLRIGFAPALSFMEMLRTRYSARIFENTPSIFGLDFGKPAYVPNDWLYTYPRVTLYTRKGL
jgi:hypothetical protein